MVSPPPALNAGPPVPSVPESARLGALRRLGIVGTGPDAHFDAICRTACALFGVPIALVSLVEAERQWFKAKCGLEIDGTPRDASFCTYAIESDAVLVVDDARADPRFAELDIVRGEPHVRFYAGAPLVLGPGLRVGSLCIWDRVPRSFPPAQQEQLRDLARAVVAHLRLHEAEGTIRQSEAAYRLLADHASELIGRWDRDGTQAYVSPASHTLLGREPADLVGTSPVVLVHPDEAETFAVQVASVLEGRVERLTAEHRFLHADGRWVWAEMALSLTRAGTTGAPDGCVATLRDISERKASEGRMAHIARHDPLTDLPNRLMLRERLDQEIALSRRTGEGFALFCLDLDRFKAVNDRFGHPAGDRLLRIVAERLADLLRKEDVLARLGGDEFVIVQTRCRSAADALALGNRLVAAIARPIDLDGQAAGIGLSLGMTLAPRDGLDADLLISQADRALYAAKALGRGRAVLYSPDLRNETEQRQTLALEIRAALDAGQIVPFYQPKVCFRSGRIVGFEALARWQHPERGVLTPAYFGSAFEEPALAVAIGQALFGQVVAEMRAWMDAGLDFGRVAVNFTSSEFRDPGLAGMILDRLAAGAVPPGHFEVEVTETVFLGHGAESVPLTLRRLDEAGILVTLDDFGTGFASLTHLKQFPVGHIKLDRSFVSNLEEDRNDAAIVAAVIGLGRNLDIRVTAEGVETEGQAERLRALGCDYAQGFRYAKPMVGSRVPWLLRTWSPGLDSGLSLNLA